MFELWAPAIGEMSYEFGLVLSATQDLGNGSSVFSDFWIKLDSYKEMKVTNPDF